MKNNKSPGNDEFSTENIKLGGSALMKILCKLYNACLRNYITLDQWNKSINQSIISLLICISQIYKLFMRIITKRLTAKLDLYQPIEQAGFRKGYGTNDHFHTIKILIKKCIEYNKPLGIIFVDFEKAFDTIDHHNMLSVLADCRIDHRYIDIIKQLYKNANAVIRLHEDTVSFQI